MSSSRPQKLQERGQSLFGQTSNTLPSLSTISTSKLEDSLRNAYKQNYKVEILMKGLESRFSDDLSNFKAIDSLLQDVYTTLQRNHKRAERALKLQVPQTKSMLEDSMDTLSELAETLPTTQTQISDIRGAYDSGRAKAHSLVSDLTWLNTEFYERWRTIIFTPSSPVSWRWKVYMRSVFVVSFVICSWLFWIAVTGAYRAHRHRLVWGEKLMS
ncbi:hypothetical protein M413DRAFT_360359 [Hebeloma cylindrosporum]|uniref:Uncharacterized protein n=1 Tax=Hebeloma cylindrosporum TaxID=76867 RepID=A0A0C3CKT4_HEBCY|nr:hypothetical protein M413DRAFT_360359 [Hebeloma cylindrosporum h7]